MVAVDVDPRLPPNVDIPSLGLVTMKKPQRDAETLRNRA